VTSELLHHLLHTNMGYDEFDCTHFYLGMVSLIQVLIKISVHVQLIGSEPIPDDMRKLVMIVICDRDLDPLVGKHCHHQSNVEDVVQKRVCIEYNHERAELSILSDWVGAVPWFANKHFKRTFRIKRNIRES
jgi:hypothetical protein